MKANTLLMFAFAFFTVTMNTACPRDIAEKVAERDKLRKEYNEKVSEHNILSIELTSEMLAFSLLGSSKSKASLEGINKKIMRFKELCGRLIELAGHDNVKDLVEDDQVPKFKSNLRLADSWQTQVKEALAKASNP